MSFISKIKKKLLQDPKLPKDRPIVKDNKYITKDILTQKYHSINMAPKEEIEFTKIVPKVNRTYPKKKGTFVRPDKAKDIFAGGKPTKKRSVKKPTKKRSIKKKVTSQKKSYKKVTSQKKKVMRK